jgi:hypothetical protein
MGAGRCPTWFARFASGRRHQHCHGALRAQAHYQLVVHRSQTRARRVWAAALGSWLLGIRASVRVCGSDVGAFAAGAFFLTGVLELSGGRSFRWDGGMERSRSVFEDASGRLLIGFEPGSMAERINTYLDVRPNAAYLSEWPLLAVLGLYLRLAMSKTFRQ